MPWARSRSVLVRAEDHEALEAESDVVERVLASVRAVRCAQAEANSRVAAMNEKLDALQTKFNEQLSHIYHSKSFFGSCY